MLSLAFDLVSRFPILWISRPSTSRIVALAPPIVEWVPNPDQFVFPAPAEAYFRVRVIIVPPSIKMPLNT